MEAIISKKIKTTPPLTYSDAGVNIDAGDALIGEISDDAKRTRRPGADAALGGFGALFDVKAAGYQDPLLVAASSTVFWIIFVLIKKQFWKPAIKGGLIIALTASRHGLCSKTKASAMLN